MGVSNRLDDELVDRFTLGLALSFRAIDEIRRRHPHLEPPSCDPAAGSLSDERQFEERLEGGLVPELCAVDFSTQLVEGAHEVHPAVKAQRGGSTHRFD